MEIPDPPGAAPIGGDMPRLDGWLERQRFAPGITIAGGLVLGFLAFQGLSLLVGFGLILADGDAASLVGMGVADLVSTYAREFLIANTVGQFAGLLALAFLFARLHTGEAARFLRFRSADPLFSLLSLVGLVALVPLVQGLGQFSDALPWPQAVRDFEAVQMDLIEHVLSQDLGLLFTLGTMALTPALCEEAFFRGYIQRQAERAFPGAMAAVVFSGVIFGLYHLRLTQALPLSLLGVYLAWLTWRSGSLWPAILVHLANNGLAVIAGRMLGGEGTDGAAALDALRFPWYVLLLSAAATVVVIRALDRRGPAPPDPAGRDRDAG